MTGINFLEVGLKVLVMMPGFFLGKMTDQALILKVYVLAILKFTKILV